jgi:hypothetical protein
MTLQVSRCWPLQRAISTHNMSLRSGSVAAEAVVACDRQDPGGGTHAIETARWEDRGEHEA